MLARAIAIVLLVFIALARRTAARNMGSKGVVEAYHKTFKRECVWQNRFSTIDD